MLHEILGHCYMQWRPRMIRYYSNPWPNYCTGPCTAFDLFTKVWEASIQHLQRGLHANRRPVHLRTPGSVPFGTCKCSNVETSLSESFFRTTIFEFPNALLFYIIVENDGIFFHNYKNLLLWWPYKIRIKQASICFSVFWTLFPCIIWKFLYIVCRFVVE